MSAYYNEIDPFAAQWLRNLIAADLIAPGDVDERSIVDVSPDDLAGYTQAHFFAGIGVWSYALRLAGWPDDRPVWTGSCPCQPFSSAGKGDGAADPRHLWPAWVRLIRERKPHALLGEQVSGVDGLAWLDLVHVDLEACDYAVGAVTLPAASVGAPHQRHRIFWVADAEHAERWPVGVDRQDGRDGPDGGRAEAHGELGACGEVCGMADAERTELRGQRGADAGAARATPREARKQRLRPDARDGGESRLVGDADEPRSQGRRRDERAERAGERAAWAASAPGGLADPDGERREGVGLRVPERGSLAPVPQAAGGSEARVMGDVDREREDSLRGISARSRVESARGPCNGFWADAEWLYCRDGKYRPVEPGTFPLATGAPARVGRLRGYGNAINAEVAAAFIRAYREVRP